VSESYVEAVEGQRDRKERFFREHPDSPVAGAEFSGLDYYPVDPDWRFVLPLHEHDDKEVVVVETTDDDERPYRRFGEFRFDVDGESVSLQAYKPVGDAGRLWVPFRDTTSGDETYGAGRYVDLDPEEHLTDDGWILDFNLAYNPTCAYNESYACPLPPSENWLDVAVEAGERAYPGKPISGADGREH